MRMDNLDDSLRRFLFGPVLQSFYASPQIAAVEMHYLAEESSTKISDHISGTHKSAKWRAYDDTACSHDLLQAWASGRIY